MIVDRWPAKASSDEQSRQPQSPTIASALLEVAVTSLSGF
jgi:hypothetical protein